MKIHFTAALRGKKEDYKKIIKKIKNLGYEIVTEHILERKIEEVEKESPKEAKEYSKKMQRWIKQADIVVSEVSKSDVSVGYEITIALNLGKPVVLLHREEQEPHALKGLNINRLIVFSYNDRTMDEVIETALREAEEQMDVRFNFFISPQIAAYLDWISKEKRVPRAVFLRRLIKEHMRNNDEYPGGIS